MMHNELHVRDTHTLSLSLPPAQLPSHNETLHCQDNKAINTSSLLLLLLLPSNIHTYIYMYIYWKRSQGCYVVMLLHKCHKWIHH